MSSPSCASPFQARSRCRYATSLGALAHPVLLRSCSILEPSRDRPGPRVPVRQRQPELALNPWPVTRGRRQRRRAPQAPPVSRAPPRRYDRFDPGADSEPTAPVAPVVIEWTTSSSLACRPSAAPLPWRRGQLRAVRRHERLILLQIAKQPAFDWIARKRRHDGRDRSRSTVGLTWAIDGAGIVAILTVPERAAAVLDDLRRGRIVGRVDDSRGWFRAIPQARRGAQKAGSALSQCRQCDRERRAVRACKFRR